MKSMIVNLAVNDIASTIIYYRENFDFELQMLVDESKTIFDTEIKKELNPNKSIVQFLLFTCKKISIFSE